MKTLLTLSLVVLLLLNVVATWAYSRPQPKFDDRNRQQVTGVIGKPVELACAVHTLGPYTVVWSANDVELSRGRSLVASDSRFNIRYGGGEQSWYLSIENGKATDAGEYVCTIDGTSMTKTFYLTMIEDFSSRRWRTDARCGAYDTIHGGQAVCDAYGAYPCCSRSGWCGFTTAHCDCYHCVDQRDVEEMTTQTALTKCKAPFELQANSDKCVVYAEDEMTWTEAQTYCQNLDAELFTFNSLDQLTKETMTIIPEGETYWIHLMTEGQGVAGSLVWRWLLGPLNSLLQGSGCSAVSSHKNIAYSHDSNCDSLRLPLCHRPMNQ